MLAVILKILQIIGIVLLSVVGLLLLLVILALVLPIRYRLSCNAEAEKKPEARFKLTYFLGILRATADYTDALYVKVKVLFFTVFQMKIPDKDSDDGEEYDLSELDEALEALDEEEAEGESQADMLPEPSDSEDDQASNNDVVQEEATEDSSEEVTEESDSSETEESVSPEEEPESSDESDTSEETDDEENSVFDKIKSKIDEICDKIKRVRSEIRYYRNLYNSNEAKNALYIIKKRLKRILKKMLPRRAHADLTFGFDSPDLTGKVYGIYTMFAGRFDKSSIVRPDFDRKVFEGSLYCKGHFNLWCILWNGLMIILNRNVLKIYRSYKHHSKRKENHEAAEKKAA